jgi:mannose/fructose/N-acetylgalactosamine-specific phosphotransferase system component IIC
MLLAITSQGRILRVMGAALLLIVLPFMEVVVYDSAGFTVVADTDHVGADEPPKAAIAVYQVD